MALQFNMIGIYGRVRNPGVAESLKALITYLKQLKQQIIIDSETAATLHDASLLSVPPQELSNRCDILIVVGGDGSLLHAAHTVINHEIPVLGINRGRLGFLTDIHPTEFQKIEAILDGNYVLEKRFLLQATV